MINEIIDEGALAHIGHTNNRYIQGFLILGLTFAIRSLTVSLEA